MADNRINIPSPLGGEGKGEGELPLPFGERDEVRGKIT